MSKRDRETDIGGNRQTDRQTDRQRKRDRETDGETDRQTETAKEREALSAHFIIANKRKLVLRELSNYSR